MGENARFKNGHARVETRVFKNTSVSKWFLEIFLTMVDSVSVRFKNASVSNKMPLNIRIQRNAGTACVSGCVLKTLACQGLRVGPSKPPSFEDRGGFSSSQHFSIVCQIIPGLLR